MRRICAVFALLVLAQASPAAGLLIPTEKKLPPLAMLNHNVTIAIDEQVAITRIEQTFRNHTDRQLEATYYFPVPKGASVRGFSMWVDGKEEKGELVEADKARKIYTDIVARTQDPGLLEYMDAGLLKLRVFPVPPKGDQKIAITYNCIATAENGLIEYVYPLKTTHKSASTLEKFGLNVTLKSQHSIHNIYSPSHAVTVRRDNDRQATIGFEKNEALLDRDFQLFYTLGAKDVGINVLTHRPSAGQNGHFLLLVAPRAELSKQQQVPRDMVFVLDTSGSMRGKRMTQARSALQYCIKNLAAQDRFAILSFATTVNQYHDELKPATPENLAHAHKWAGELEASGGTAIDAALTAALALRSKDESRPFTVVFFTDGRPTIGETNTDKIVDNAKKKNSASTRIFTFGVGDDVNATMLDKLAEDTRALASYVRETEDIENKVSSLYSKISNPVLANLKLSVSGADVSLNEVYPPQMPDLFHGSQLVVLGRYTGQGHVAIKLTGNVGAETKEFVYEIKLADKTAEEKPFVEDLWARRKVGYLLDQVRANGEKKELIEEIITLAKRYGITTPYTSYLVVPDTVAAAPAAGRPNVAFNPGPQAKAPALLQKGADGKEERKLLDVLKEIKNEPAQASAPAGEAGGLGAIRGKLAAKDFDEAEKNARDEPGKKIAKDAREQQDSLDRARRFIQTQKLEEVQAGSLGVNLSLYTEQLRNQNQVARTANRMVQNRNLLEVGGVWIDDRFDAKLPTVTVKAQSKAYFRILELHPKMREVFGLGNHVVWVAPNGSALVLDQANGQEEIADADINRLFVVERK